MKLDEVDDMECNEGSYDRDVLSSACSEYEFKSLEDDLPQFNNSPKGFLKTN
jgi:hypothetical protein